MNAKGREAPIPARMTADGFIEIKELRALDEIVGGLMDPDAIVCEVADEPERRDRRTPG